MPGIKVAALLKEKIPLHLYLTKFIIPFTKHIKIYKRKIIHLQAMQHLEEDLQVRWLKLRIKLKEKFGIKPDMNGVLLLIGIQELGKGPREYSKEEKQDLMHIAVCTILMPSGYYQLEGNDEEGWPHFKQLKPLPEFNMIEQENFLKDHALLYFQSLNFI